MPQKNHIGTISLLATAGGFGVMEYLSHFHVVVPGTGWTVVQAGFEAGMVGGFADWFAVSALFRPIPSKRFRIPHTNLLVEKRATLSAGIVDMVQNRWLSPETVAEHLTRLSASRFILEHLSQPSTRTQVVQVARDLLGRLAGSLNAPEIAGFLDRALRDQLAGLELGPTFGKWLEARINAGDTAPLWDFLAGSLAKSAEQGDFNLPIRNMLETAANNYKDRGFWERVKASLGEMFFDYEELTENISTAFARSLRGIQNDDNHPLRGKLDQQLLGFATKLARGDREACATLDQFQRRLVENAELAPLLARILSRLQETLKAQLADPEAHLSHLLDCLLENLVQELRDEPQTQARLDEWVRRAILNLAERNHGVIGEMVAGSLSKLSDGDLVAQIEGKVGGDLQYIRLNGAVVGSMVGMLLAITKLILK
jgi:uncharacterized membrane-anchored protein YjiN (DUF445 family)